MVFQRSMLTYGLTPPSSGLAGTWSTCLGSGTSATSRGMVVANDPGSAGPPTVTVPEGGIRNFHEKTSPSPRSTYSGSRLSVTCRASSVCGSESSKSSLLNSLLIGFCVLVSWSCVPFVSLTWNRIRTAFFFPAAVFSATLLRKSVFIGARLLFGEVDLASGSLWSVDPMSTGICESRAMAIFYFHILTIWECFSVRICCWYDLTTCVRSLLR